LSTFNQRLKTYLFFESLPGYFLDIRRPSPVDLAVVSTAQTTVKITTNTQQNILNSSIIWRPEKNYIYWHHQGHVAVTHLITSVTVIRGV